MDVAGIDRDGWRRDDGNSQHNDRTDEIKITSRHDRS